MGLVSVVRKPRLVLFLSTLCAVLCVLWIVTKTPEQGNLPISLVTQGGELESEEPPHELILGSAIQPGKESSYTAPEATSEHRTTSQATVKTTAKTTSKPTVKTTTKTTSKTTVQTTAKTTPETTSGEAISQQTQHRHQETKEASHRPPWTSFPPTLETVPVCVEEPEVTVCSNASLPELVFVVGTSGSGHHLLKALFSNISAYALMDFIPFLHIYEPGRDNDWSNLYYAIVEERILRKRLQYLVDHLTAAQREGKRGVVVVGNSFPMGKGAGMQVTGRPDLLSLNKFHCDLFHLKLVIIRRHPLPSVMSTVHKYRDVLAKQCALDTLLARKKGTSLNTTTLPYMVKARILESELMYIDQQIRRLGCHQQVFMDYDRIQDEATRKGQVQKLTTFLQLDTLYVDSMMSVELQSPLEPPVAIPPLCTLCVEKTLYDFFLIRQMMWPLLAPQ